MRALIRFGKLARLRFISHLDLQRFMQRALRRTNLPVAYSQGFNPHPRISFASALATGWVSECEILDVRMAQEVTREQVMEQMGKALPKDMPVYTVRLVEDRHPAMMAQLRMADYEIRFSGEAGEELLDQADEFMKAQSVMAMRKTKSGETLTDIRPMAISLKASKIEGGQVQLKTRLQLTEKATLKPDLLVSALAEMAGIEAPEHSILRTALLGIDESGEPKDLLYV